MQLDEFGNPIEEGTSQEGMSPIKKRRKSPAKSKPNLNGKSLKDILGLADKYQQKELTKFSVDHIPIEHQICDDITEMPPIIKGLVDKGDNIIKTYPELSKDMFLSLYKAYPEMVEIDDMKGNYKLNHNVLDGLTEDSQYQILRDYCQMDEFSSALASITMHESAIEKLQELKEEFDQQGGDNVIDGINQAIASEQELQDLMDKAKALQQINQQIQDAGGQPNQQLKDLEGKLMMDLASALKIADERAKAFKKVMQDNPDQMHKVQQAVSSGVNEAVTTVSEAQDTVEAWGFDRGSEIRVPIDSKIRAIQMIKNSNKLKKFSDIIGKLREVAKREQKAKTKNGVSNIKSVTIGNELQFVLPSEKMLLNNEVTKRDFYKRYFEGNLLQYELDNVEKKGRGPLIVCVDDSGSMTGDRERWAKAFAMALLDIAQMQKRNYCIILFESDIVDVVIQEKGKLDPARIVEICERHSGGGTDFERPLNKALEILKDNRFKKGDIVFLTDGECSVSPQFLKKFKQVKEDKEFACRGIVINVGGHTCKSTLDLFCDEVIHLTKFVDLTADGAVAEQIFREI